MKIAKFTPVSHVYRPLDERPLPDYEPFGIKDMIDRFSRATRGLYSYSREDPRPFVIVASRSCPFTCTFCVHNRTRPPYRTRSIPNIMQELKFAYEKYHYNILIILDELFAVNKARMKDFCLAVLEGKKKYHWDFDWMFQTHASAKLDLGTLTLAKEAGCVMFSYGLESASPKVLKSMNKKIKPEQVIEAISLADEAEVGFGANFIFGDPAETEFTFCESLEFWFRYCGTANVFLTGVMPYPGSKIFADCETKGIIKDKAQYYETIHTLRNMTSMPDHIWTHWMYLMTFIEGSWIWVKTTPANLCEKQTEKNIVARYNKASVYRFGAVCPFCKKQIYLKFIMQEDKKFQYLGTACPKCNRKIKIQLKEESC